MQGIKLDKDETGALLLPLCGKQVPEPMLTDMQFMDWVRLTQRTMPLYLGNRGRKAKVPVEPSWETPAEESTELEELTDLVPEG